MLTSMSIPCSVLGSDLGVLCGEEAVQEWRVVRGFYGCSFPLVVRLDVVRHRMVPLQVHQHVGLQLFSAFENKQVSHPGVLDIFVIQELALNHSSQLCSGEDFIQLVDALDEGQATAHLIEEVTGLCVAHCLACLSSYFGEP